MQEINIQSYYKNLEQGLKTCYCLAGSEPLQKLESIEALKKQAKQAGYEIDEQITVTAKMDFSALDASISGGSLFFSKKFFHLDFGDKKPTKTALSPLLELVPKIADSGDILLLTMDRLDKASIKTKWFGQLMQDGVVVQFWDIDADKLPSWIMQRSKNYAYKLTAEGADFLANTSFGNLLAAAGELEKLKFICETGQSVDASFLQSISYDASSFSIFDLNAFLVAGDLAKVYKVLEYLKSSNAEKNLVLWTLSKEVRLLLNMKLAMQNGENFDDLCRANKIWKNKGDYAKLLQRINSKKLEFALKKASQLDGQIKSSIAEDFWSNSLDICRFLVK